LASEEMKRQAWQVIAGTAVWLRQLGDCPLCASRV
jgi:hypothetical protein